MFTYEQLQALARVILPEEIIENFDIVDIEEKAGVVHILLDEQAIPPEGYSMERLSPNGFFPSSRVYDFLIRDDFVATDKSIENSDIFLPVIKHQFFYIADS